MLKRLIFLTSSVLFLSLAHAPVSAQTVEQEINVLTERAKAGDARSLSALGYLFIDGKKIERDIPRAIKYFEEAAAKGDIDAILALGYQYWSERTYRQIMQRPPAIFNRRRTRATQGPSPHSETPI
jgi:TPR repeat protein